MASLKEIKSRIASVRNTQKITSAMRMVASAKLHHTQGMTEAFLRYKNELQLIVDSLQFTVDSSMRTDDQQGASQLSTLNAQLSTLLIPISSNSGLCGAFNSNMGKATLSRIQELEQMGKQVHLLPIGKKIAHELRKTERELNTDFVQLLDKIGKNNDITGVSALVAYAIELYQHKEIDEVEFIYHHFKSMGSQVIQVDSLQLTVNSSMRADDQQQDDSQLSTLNSQLSTYLTEPSPEELLTSLFPRLLNAKVYGILLDSLTSEHAARMLAMQTADDNANDLLKELTLLYNKTRQQSITNELIDIMSGKIGEH
ncbi:MAG: ATP synthase F1 subunit gamma [Bacteroidaceae bacterium]|nr:ATP synthase F1 subunit gamma [Bacteroidaceae bacterium]